MTTVIIKGKVFVIKPLWDEWLLNTDFTSDTNPYLYDYFIDGVKVTKENFEKQYQSQKHYDMPEMDRYGK